jgi:hypothetical protein
VHCSNVGDFVARGNGGPLHFGDRRSFGAVSAIVGAGAVCARQTIGSTATAQAMVTAGLAETGGALTVGDRAYRNRVARKCGDSFAILVLVDSTNPSVGPASRLVLYRSVCEGDPAAQRDAVNLANSVLRLAAGSLHQYARTITISTRNAAIGRSGIGLEQERRNRGRAFSGSVKTSNGGHCEWAEIRTPGRAALVNKIGSAKPVKFASLCVGDLSLCADASYADNESAGGAPGGVLCGR